MRIGAGLGGSGVYELRGGGLLAVAPPPADAAGGTVVGGAGVGLLRLGDSASGGTLFHAPRWNAGICR